MQQSSFDRKSELDAFKEVNLTVIASENGYRVVKQKSTRHSILMASPNDKIIVSKNGRHYIYCSVFNESSNGTAIDFAYNIIEPGASLGRVRQILRPYLDGAFVASVERKNKGKYANKIHPSSVDLMAIAARMAKFEPIISHHPYLCDERRIPLELLKSERLKGCVFRCPNNGSAVFPHWGVPDGDATNAARCVTGYEIKSDGVNLFSSRGRKGLWASRAYTSDRILVFCESAIDALSYLVLNPSKVTRVVSVSGQLNSCQHQLINLAIEKMAGSSLVVAGFDSDRHGDALSEKLSTMVSHCHNDKQFLDRRPSQSGWDWNQVLSLTK